MIVTTATELLALKRAGKVAAQALNVAKSLIRAGMSTAELNQIIEDVIRQNGLKAAFKRVPGYKYASCISVGAEVVHAPPSPDKIIQPGDVVSIDTGAICNGYYSDTAISLVIPPASDEAENLVYWTKKALEKAIAAAQPGKPLGDITDAIADAAKGLGMTPQLFPIKSYTSHGVGTALHEPPVILNQCSCPTRPEYTQLLEPGSVIAIEPMLTCGTGDTIVQPDGWTVVTTDKKLAAHFEHTILVSDQGVTILTEDK